MTKQLPAEALERSVQEFPKAENATGPGANGILTLMVASAADIIQPWGKNQRLRDKQLREFWPTETHLAGTVGTICDRNAVFDYKLDGESDRLVRVVDNYLQNAIVGQTRGWVPFVNAWSVDFYTQDNGAFIELIRAEDSPSSPVIGIAHLDSGACVRTGDPMFPVYYQDIDSKWHKMPWYSVIAVSALPSPIQTMNGVGLCAVSRVMRAAQILREVATFKHEKVAGRFERAIHLVGGIGKAEIIDVRNRAQSEADNAGQSRYILPTIITGIDPEKPVTHVQIDMASLPDNFDLDKELKWYITDLALGFGEDYQTLAPLPGGNLGTSTQSEVLHRKALAKSPAFFMKLIHDLFKLYGVIPKTVEFEFEEQDADEELREASLREARARDRSLRLNSGELTVNAARQLAIEAGDLKEEHLKIIEEDEAEEEARMEEERRAAAATAAPGVKNPSAESVKRPDKGGKNPRGRPSLLQRVTNLGKRNV